MTIKKDMTLDEILNNINHPNLYKIYSDKLFCDSKIKDRCLVHDLNHTFYLDNNHLSYYGNKILSKIVIEKIKEIEKKVNDTLKDVKIPIFDNFFTISVTLNPAVLLTGGKSTRRRQKK